MDKDIKRRQGNFKPGDLARVVKLGPAMCGFEVGDIVEIASGYNPKGCWFALQIGFVYRPHGKDSNEKVKGGPALGFCDAENLVKLVEERDHSQNAQKVTLPRKIAEALEKAKKQLADFGEDAELVAWNIPDRGYAEKKGKTWLTLHEYAEERGKFFELIDALRYGYDIEDEPITVTITPEKIDSIKNSYFMSTFQAQEGIKDVLRALDIKIPGVNA